MQSPLLCAPPLRLSFSHPKNNGAALLCVAVALFCEEERNGLYASPVVSRAGALTNNLTRCHPPSILPAGSG